MNAPYPQLVEVLRDRRRALGLARDQPLAPPSIIRVSRRPLPSPNCSAARVHLLLSQHDRGEVECLSIIRGDWIKE